MRKGNDHFYNRFLVELFLPLGSFSFYPLPFLFFLFKPGVIKSHQRFFAVLTENEGVLSERSGEQKK